MSRRGPAFWAAGVLIALATSLAFFFAQSARPLRLGEVRSHPLAPGWERVDFELRRGLRAAGIIHAVYIEPDAVRPRLVLNPERAPLAQIAPEAPLVVNAAFFTPEWRPTGLLVTAGKVLYPLVPGAGSGVFVLGEAPYLLDRNEAKTLDTQSARLAIQAGPRLIERGEQPGIHSDDGVRANRTVIGADRRGRMVVLSVFGPGGPSSGPSLYELQELLRADDWPRALRLGFALNLDGGPSSGIYLHHSAHGLARAEAAPVQSVLVLESAP